jgi:hypothetical protein
MLEPMKKEKVAAIHVINTDAIAADSNSDPRYPEGGSSSTAPSGQAEASGVEPRPPPIVMAEGISNAKENTIEKTRPTHSGQRTRSASRPTKTRW